MDKINYEAFNIGLGKGISVLELIKIFEKTNRVKVNYKFTEKRNGDSAISFADNNKFINFFNWRPKYKYEDMCRDSWKQRN